MNAESLCSRHIVSLDGRESLQRAAQLMRDHHVGAIVVTEEKAEGVRVSGIVTDRDLAIEVLARGGDASRVPVSRLVSGPPVGVDARAGVEHAVRAMEAVGVRRLLVHDEAGHLVGLLSLDDLLPALAAPLAGLAAVMRQGTEREAARRDTLAPPARPVLRVPAMGTAGWKGEGPIG
ncbi:MAG: CBS domain-containing protein [Rubrivivax sp.]|nr:CBS domain-containing protein [Rubrivivax sp.]